MPKSEKIPNKKVLEERKKQLEDDTKLNKFTGLLSKEDLDEKKRIEGIKGLLSDEEKDRYELLVEKQQTNRVIELSKIYAHLEELNREKATETKIYFNEVDDNTFYLKKYSREQAIKASTQTAKEIAKKIENKDRSPTRITNPILHNNVIRSLKKLNSTLKVKININFEFGAFHNNIFQNLNGKEILKEFITDATNAYNITFISEDSKIAFLNAANEFRVKINEKILKVRAKSSTMSNNFIKALNRDKKKEEEKPLPNYKKVEKPSKENIKSSNTSIRKLL